jgi:elongation factor P--beta-lysine ligase/ribosomal protein S18 acetylase RimI-like enzyme
MSPEHAQDYTQMENYRAYADYRQMMALVKDMYMHIIDTVYPHKNRKFTIRWYEVDFNQEWQEIDYATIIQEKTSIDIFTATEQEIESKLRELNVKYEPHNRIRLIDTLRKYCRKQLSWPAFLINVPTFISPLAKSKIDRPELTNRFQVIIAGSEVGNGFSELNDPLDQRSRFEEQQAMRDAGDDEAQMADREYVEALEHGMPPTAWFGVSERLFCFLEDKPIREAQYFPLMKPEHNPSKETVIARSGSDVAIQDMITYKDNLSPDDREIYKKIRLECLSCEKDAFGDKYDVESAFTEQEWKDKMQKGYLILAFDKNVPVGIMRAMPRKEDPSVGGIFAVYVNESYRSQGIASHMLQKCIHHIFTTLNLKKVRLDVFESAPIAKSFYEKHWFKAVWSKETEINGKIYPDIVMELTKDDYSKITTSSTTPRNDVVYTNLPSTSQAQALANKYLTDTLQHCEQVAKVMQHFAHKLWQDQDAWYIAW